MRRLSPRGIKPATTDGHVLTTTAGKAGWAAPGGTLLDLDDLGDVDTVTTAPADGDTLKFHAGSGLWIPGRVVLDELADVAAATPASGDVLQWNGSAWAPGAVAGGGGGGGNVLLLENTGNVPAGTAVGTVVFRKAPPATIWDFRTMSALPAGWTRRGVTSETFGAQGLTATLAAGQGYSFVSADANSDYTLEAYIFTGSYAGIMQGIMANLSTGAGTASIAYNSPTGNLAATVNTSYQYGGTFQNGGGSPAYPMLLRLRKSGNAFYASMSTNAGTTWTGEAPLTNAGIYQNIGFGSLFGAATLMTISYFKMTLGGTSPTSGLRGWWDGSALVPF